MEHSVLEDERASHTLRVVVCLATGTETGPGRMPALDIRVCSGRQVEKLAVLEYFSLLILEYR